MKMLTSCIHSFFLFFFYCFVLYISLPLEKVLITYYKVVFLMNFCDVSDL